MDNCERCRQRCGWHDRPVQLRGGITALLCSACLTAWHAYVNGLPEYAHIQRLDAQQRWFEARAQAGDAPTLEEFKRLREDEDTVDQALFRLGQQWLQMAVPTTG